MKWLRKKRGKAGEVRAKIAEASNRAAEAESALQNAEQAARRVEHQARVADRLRDGWARVHERNHLADLFVQDYRRTHG